MIAVVVTKLIQKRGECNVGDDDDIERVHEHQTFANRQPPKATEGFAQLCTGDNHEMTYITLRRRRGRTHKSHVTRFLKY